MTQQHVLPKFVATCPVSGKSTLQEHFAACNSCHQQVSAAALDAGVCLACHRLAAVSKDDPRLIWILGEHVGLDRWTRWKLSETQHVYIAEAWSWLRRLLVVVDKETLEVRHMADRGRLSMKWQPVDGMDRARELA